MARMTSGGMMEPPSTVTTPTPLMTGFMPNPAYNEDGDDAVRPAPVAALAAAGARAAVPRRRRRVSFITYDYMIHMMRLPSLLLCATTLIAQAPYDLLLKGGHVIDAKNKISAVRDVAVRDGKIAAVAPNIAATQARKVVNVAGFYVTPGLIDLHAHVFAGSAGVGLAGGHSSIFPDDFALRVGVTTVVDAGSSGRHNFAQFKKTVIDRARTRVLALLNIG